MVGTLQVISVLCATFLIGLAVRNWRNTLRRRKRGEEPWPSFEDRYEITTLPNGEEVATLRPEFRRDQST